jgi:hypothetical protein
MKTLTYSSLILITILVTAHSATAQLTWTKLNCPVRAQKIAVSSSGSLYATGYISGGYATYYSNDKGATWNILTHVLSALTCDSSGGVFYTDTERQYSKDSSEITFVSVRRYSNDFGASYRTVTLPGFGSLEASNLALYFANDSNLLRSTDNGLTWTAIDTVPPRSSPHCGSNDRVIVGFGTRWHYFEDGRLIKAGFLPHGDSVHYGADCFIANDNYTYVEWSGAFYRMKVGATYWECYDSSLASAPSRFRPVICSANVLIEEDSASTRASYDHGTTWSQIGDGTGEPFVISSFQPQWAHDPFGNLYARRNYLVYRSSYFAGVHDNDPRYKLSIYPNPAENIVTLNIPDVRNVSFFDETGREIISQDFAASSEERTIDVAHLRTGVYMILATTWTSKYCASFLKR